MEERVDATIKIVLIGDTNVGKTNLLGRFISEVTGEPFSSNSLPTIGVDFASQILVYPGGIRLKVQIWDTAGQERYRAITRSHYRRAQGALLVYDISDRRSFENAQTYWVREIQNAAGEDAQLAECIFLLGNKTDLPKEQWAVAEEEHRAAAEGLGVKDALRTSSHSGENVVRAFRDLAFRTYERLEGAPPLKSYEGFSLQDGRREKGGCC
ncbi:unnamed protein product [Heterosigma akashiwo]|mmetsp:Transcript_14558/g.22140  ORF Transcript_14558/g.22140 Transcript_14558/m.22140 type:complete len:211 (-) Transcript_14558:477-1109(-)